MNQQEIIHRYYIIGVSTLDKVLQVLNHLSMEGIEKLTDARFPMSGETNLYKLMNRSDPLTSVFLNKKVNLEALKQALTSQGLPFSFKESDEGTHLFFRVKDQELAKKGLESVIQSIKKHPQKVLQRYNSQTFEERIRKAKEVRQYTGRMSHAPTKTKGGQSL